MNKSIIKKIHNIGHLFGSAIDFANSLEWFWEIVSKLPDGKYAFREKKGKLVVGDDNHKLMKPLWMYKYFHNFTIEDGILSTIIGAGTHSVYIKVSLSNGDLLYAEPDRFFSLRCWKKRDYSERIEYIYHLWNRKDNEGK